MDIPHGMIPLVLMWGAIVAIILIGSITSYMNRQSHYRILEKLVEKGQPIPPEYLSIGRRYDRYRGSIGGGIFLMCIGVAIFIFFWALFGGGVVADMWNPGVDPRGSGWLPFIGIFPFMVGLARLLAGIFDRPRPPSDK